MKKNFAVSVVVAILFISMGNVANAQFYAGANVGLINYFDEGLDNYRTQFGASAAGMYFVNDQFAFEGNMGYFFKSKKESLLSITTTVSSLLLNANGKFMLSDGDNPFYLCSDLGINNFKITLKTDVDKTSSSFTFFGIAPGAGVLIGKDNDVSFRVEAKYHIYFENNDYGNGLNGLSVVAGVYKKF